MELVSKHRLYLVSGRANPSLAADIARHLGVGLGQAARMTERLGATLHPLTPRGSLDVSVNMGSMYWVSGGGQGPPTYGVTSTAASVRTRSASDRNSWRHVLT
jgi:hypothetical protein